MAHRLKAPGAGLDKAITHPGPVHQVQDGDNCSGSPRIAALRDVCDHQVASDGCNLATSPPADGSNSPVALWSAFGRKGAYGSNLGPSNAGLQPSKLSSADPRIDRPASHDRSASQSAGNGAAAGDWDRSLPSSWNAGFPGFSVAGRPRSPPRVSRHFRSISTPTSISLGDPFDLTWNRAALSPPVSPAAGAACRLAPHALHSAAAAAGSAYELGLPAGLPPSSLPGSLGGSQAHSRLPSSGATTVVHSRASSSAHSGGSHSRAPSAGGGLSAALGTPPRLGGRLQQQQQGAAPWSSGSGGGGGSGPASGVHSRVGSRQTAEGVGAAADTAAVLLDQLDLLDLSPRSTPTGASGGGSLGLGHQPSALERLYNSSGGSSCIGAAEPDRPRSLAGDDGATTGRLTPPRAVSPSAAADAGAARSVLSSPGAGGSVPGHHRSSSVPNINWDALSAAAALGLVDDADEQAHDLASQDWPDLTSEPSRHMWVGNLATKLHRSALRSLFEAHAGVEDVVTFPGRMYAFVNFRTVEDAVHAHARLDGQQVPELTCGRRLVLKFRPSKKAIGRVRGDSASAALAGDYTQDSVLLDPVGQQPAAAATAAGSVGSDADGEHAAGGDTARAAAAAAAAAGKTVGEWEGSTVPSPRVWMGNLTAGVTAKTLRSVFGPFGAVADAAVFPGRIGPLGYAFVNFEEVAAASQAFESLNNTVVPLLTGTKQLKMRFKPVKEYEEGRAAAAAAVTTTGPASPREDGPDSPAANSPSAADAGAGAAVGPSAPPLGNSNALAAAASAPASAAQGARSRHLWLGNLVAKPSRSSIEDAFGAFGRLAGVRVFPGKTYAFVNYELLEHAEAALAALDGAVVSALTAGKPLVVRYQLDPDAREKKRSSGSGGGGSNPTTATAAAAAAVAPGGGGGVAGPGADCDGGNLAVAPPASSMMLGAGMAAPGNGGGRSRSASASAALDDSAGFPTLNLSNRLNPNNTHYDHELAMRYKRMSKADKEALWAQDRLVQEQLRRLHKAAQGGGPAAAAQLGGLDLASLVQPLALQMLGLGPLSHMNLSQLFGGNLGGGLGGGGAGGGFSPLLAQAQQQQQQQATLASLAAQLQQQQQGGGGGYGGGLGLHGGDAVMQAAQLAAALQQQQQLAAAAAMMSGPQVGAGGMALPHHGRCASEPGPGAGLFAGQDFGLVAQAYAMQQQQQAQQRQQQQHMMKWEPEGGGQSDPLSFPPGLGYSPNSINIKAMATAPAAAVQQMADASAGFAPGGGGGGPYSPHLMGAQLRQHDGGSGMGHDAAWAAYGDLQGLMQQQHAGGGLNSSMHGYQ